MYKQYFGLQSNNEGSMQTYFTTRANWHALKAIIWIGFVDLFTLWTSHYVNLILNFLLSSSDFLLHWSWFYEMVCSSMFIISFVNCSWVGRETLNTKNEFHTHSWDLIWVSMILGSSVFPLICTNYNLVSIHFYGSI